MTTTKLTKKFRTELNEGKTFYEILDSLSIEELTAIANECTAFLTIKGEEEEEEEGEGEQTLIDTVDQQNTVSPQKNLTYSHELPNKFLTDKFQQELSDRTVIFSEVLESLSRQQIAALMTDCSTRIRDKLSQKVTTTTTEQLKNMSGIDQDTKAIAQSGISALDSNLEKLRSITKSVLSKYPNL